MSGITSLALNQAKCPRCQMPSKRKPDYGQCTTCIACSREQCKVYQFCWACRREWESKTETCTLPKCGTRAALISTQTITVPNSSVLGCPFFRACPSCSAVLTHSGIGCSNVACVNCKVSFCYRCLKRGFCSGACAIVDNSDSIRALGL